MSDPFASLAGARAWYRDGGTATGLALRFLVRLAQVDRGGPRLNSVPVVDIPLLLRRAAELDAVPPAARGSLHGVPVTAKDSFAAAGLTMAAGSPAFAHLRARESATVVARLEAEGALLVGKTTMPPLAIGGGQPGAYGRARSPYNPDYLAAAWHSGSSIGSGVSVAAGLACISLAEETVSSGRSPASNNGLTAYTPSWGVIPSTGNWPLHRYRDVVVPLAHSVADLAATTAVLAGGAEDDVWRRQDALDLGADADATVAELRDLDLSPGALRGAVVGVPALYVDEQRDGVEPLPIRASVLDLWTRLEAVLTLLGAEVRRVGFPIVEAYEGRRVDSDLVALGYLPDAWERYELDVLTPRDWEGHLARYAGPGSGGLAAAAPGRLRPDAPDSLDVRTGVGEHAGRDAFDYAGMAAAARRPADPDLEREALLGLDRARRELFDDWMAAEGLDVLAFPANQNVGPWDADANPVSAAQAWRDGVVFSNGNHVLRRVGIPSVTVPMGRMADTGMPVGATICVPARHDARAFRIAADLERALPAAEPAPLPPSRPLPDDAPLLVSGEVRAAALVSADGVLRLRVDVSFPGAAEIVVLVDDDERRLPAAEGKVEYRVPTERRRRLGGESLVVAWALDDAGRICGVAATEVVHEFDDGVRRA